MTTIHSFGQFVDEIQEYRDSKDNPEEWYVLRGNMVTDYSVWADEELPEDYDEMQQEMPPEDRDANPPVEGVFQIGAAGWLVNCFEFGEGRGFVSELQWGDDIERNLLNLLVVHESVLSEHALEIATGETEPQPASDGSDQA